MPVKTLEEINREFMSGNIEREIISVKPAAASSHRKSSRGALSIISGILCYIAILLILFSVLTSSRYSFYTVITPGISDEIPQGSLILVRHTDTQTTNEDSTTGDVLFTIPAAGAALSWLADHIYIVSGIFGVCTVLYLINKKGMKKENEKGNENKANRNPV